MKRKLCCIATISATIEEFMIPAMEKFLAEGYEVTLIANMTQDFIEKYSNRYECIDLKMKRAISIHDIIVMPLKLYSIFRRGNYDYVQYATTLASIYSSIAAWAARIPTRVACLWGISYYTKKGLSRFITRLSEKIPCMLATHTSIPSHKNQKIGADGGLFRLEHSSVIGDGGTIGVDLKKFDITKRVEFCNQVLNEIPELRGKLVYGYLGRIYRDKGVNELLEAYLKIRDKDTALLLIGNMDSAQSPLNADILGRAQKCSDIIFLGYTGEVAKYLSAIDILVHPTYHEGFSMAIQQALAMGCAIVTTDVAGPSEVIENGFSGITVEARNVDSLVEGMQQLRNENLRASFIKNGLRRVREKFSRERMVELTYQNRKEIMEGRI